MKKFWRALIISVVSVILITSVVFALTTFFTVPWDMTVVIPTVKSVTVYSDNACTQIITAMHWGNVNPNQVLTFDFYLKNTGNMAVTANMTIPENMAGILTGITFMPTSLSLATGQSGKMTFSATVASNAMAGLKSGTFVGQGD